MSSFDYTKIAQIISEELGYHLFVDYGTLEATDAPYRRINQIVTPIVGVFRINPAKITSLPYPYIGVCSATIDIPAPSEQIEEVRAALNDMAGRLHSTAWKIEQGDTRYSVVYTFESPVVGTRRRDVPAYGGEVIPVTQVMNITVVEAGISAFDVSVKIDGIDVPLLNMMETRTAASETTPNANAKGEVTISQELYGITLTTAAVENTLGDLLGEIVSEGNGNCAHAVEVIRAGVSKVYMMVVGTAGATVQPPNNVGYNVSLAEVSAQSAMFNDLWERYEEDGMIVKRYVRDGVIFWGDGHGERASGTVSHTYVDGRMSHTVFVMRYDQDVSRWGNIKVGAILYGKIIKTVSPLLQTVGLPEHCIVTDYGDILGTYEGRLKMTVGFDRYEVDDADTILVTAISRPFLSLMRGKVTSVSNEISDKFLYDRWSVGLEG